MCDSTVRTQIRDVTLASLSRTVDDADTLAAIEWATEETVDALALGTRSDADLADYYAGTAFRGRHYEFDVSRADRPRVDVCRDRRGRHPNGRARQRPPGGGCMTDAVVGRDQTVYNRPAAVVAVHGDTARVRWQDNGTLGYVSLEALAQ